MQEITNNLRLAPFYRLHELSTSLIKKMTEPISVRDDFSWVYGLSETEIVEFGMHYDGLKKEMLHQIDLTGDSVLRRKLLDSFDLLPVLNVREFILNKHSMLMILLAGFQPYRKLRLSRKLQLKLEIIRNVSEKLTSSLEYPELFKVSQKPIMS